jgi:signal transduction histidine kinase
MALHDAWRAVGGDGAESRGRTVLVATGSVAAVGLIAITAVIGFDSPLVDRPAVFVSLRLALCAGLVAVALAVLRRRSNARLATSLVAIAVLLALTGLTAADSPVPFTIGRLAVPVATLAGIHFFLAYPSDRIEDRRTFLGFWACSAVLLTLDVANVVVAGDSPVIGPFVRCNADCPVSPLSLVDLGPSASSALSAALALAAATTAVAAAILVTVRAVRANGVQRHRLVPLLPWGLLAAIGYAAFVGARVIDQDGHWLSPAAVIVAAIVAAMPLAIAFGIASGRAFAIGALKNMVSRLGDAPSPRGLQRAMSLAFADPALRLLFWRPALQRYVDVEGAVVAPSAIPPSLKLSRFDHSGDGVAAVVHDPALSDERDILEAGAAAVRLALDGRRLETALTTSVSALEASRQRLAAAADHERRRIERDLHDGAQHDLVALSLELRMLEQLAAEDPAAVVRGLADASRRIDAAINHIRDLAKGIYPSTLRDFGLHDAVAAAARTLPFELAFHSETRSRFPTEVEAAVYFCCLEAVQNIAKHCGPDVRASLRLFEQGGRVHFIVADDGPGFAPTEHMGSRGITDMRDRLEAVGGELTIVSAPGMGTTITGAVRVSPEAVC